MNKTKWFIEDNPKWFVLWTFVSRIESFWEVDPGLAIENCKSLVESIFKTIIVEVWWKIAEDIKDCDIWNLRKQTRDLLRLNGRWYEHMIWSFTNSVSEFRNKLWETSHWKDIYTLREMKDVLLENEVKFIIAATDNIGYFLLNHYTNHYISLIKDDQELRYEDNEEFNEFLDSQSGELVIWGVILLPSKVLFDQDIEAYKLQLQEYIQDKTQEIIND